LAEKALANSKGDLNVCIFRPAVIACSNSEPVPGWTDSLSAAGGLTILGGLGLVTILPGTGLNVFDVIPVDIVSNGIIVTSAEGAVAKAGLKVYNSGSSV